MRLLFLNRVYWPEEPATAQLLTDLAEALAARGHHVTVLTRRPREPAARTEQRHGVRIVRLRTTRLAQAGVIGKALDYLTFLFAVSRALRREVTRDTTVIAMTDPPLLAIVAARAKAARGGRLIHWVQDIYPELAVELSGQRSLNFLRRPRDRAWRSADACVTLGADMAGVLRAAGVSDRRIHVVPNAAPAGLQPQPPAAGQELRAAWGLLGRFVVQYSGNLGRVHDLAVVLQVAELLRGRPEIVFLFVGAGARRAPLEAEARRRNLANVRFMPPQPRAKLAASLAVGDVHLVTLRPGCEQLVFPSKLAGIFAAGRGVIFIGPPQCEVARQVRASGAGLVFSAAQPAAIAASIETLARSPHEVGRLAEHATAQAASAVRADEAWTRVLDSVSAIGDTAAPQP